MPITLRPGMTLRSPDGRLWRVRSLIPAQHLVQLDRLEKRPREHQLVTKSEYPVVWNWAEVEP